MRPQRAPVRLEHRIVHARRVGHDAAQQVVARCGRRAGAPSARGRSAPTAGCAAAVCSRPARRRRGRPPARRAPAPPPGQGARAPSAARSRRRRSARPGRPPRPPSVSITRDRGRDLGGGSVRVGVAGPTAGRPVGEPEPWAVVGERDVACGVGVVARSKAASLPHERVLAPKPWSRTTGAPAARPGSAARPRWPPRRRRRPPRRARRGRPRRRPGRARPGEVAGVPTVSASGAIGTTSGPIRAIATMRGEDPQGDLDAERHARIHTTRSPGGAVAPRVGRPSADDPSGAPPSRSSRATPQTGDLGVATASKFLAVGAGCRSRSPRSVPSPPRAYANTSFGPRADRRR